jgi:hypothetical protein
MKKTSWKILVVFWLIAIILLAGWYVFLQVRNRNIENLKPLVKIAPVGSERQNEISALMDIYSQIACLPMRQGGSNCEKNLLVLFQNDLELRPGGGFVGAFGVVKVKKGKIADIQVFDTGNFDKNIPNTEMPPAPLTDILGTESWKMRDSNWSPDFKADAEKAEYFYKLGGGKENIDGVVAINTQVLNSVLAITGPVKIEGYPGEYRDENAILQLEYQVEKGYAEQGIEKAGRKNIMGELADVLSQKIQSLNISQQFALAQKMEDHLKQKDIQLFFQDENLQKEIENIDWGGRVKEYSGDYLMAVDANLLALKSDYCIQRKMDYGLDLTGENPQAVLNITYNHTCRAKDWMTTDYRDWLRVYVPEDSYLTESSGETGDIHPHTNNEISNNSDSISENNIGVGASELGKKVFGMHVDVPVGENKTITLKYRLPQSLKNNNYHLLVQKQSGSGEVPFEISVKKPDGSEFQAQENLVGDKEFGF